MLLSRKRLIPGKSPDSQWRGDAAASAVGNASATASSSKTAMPRSTRVFGNLTADMTVRLLFFRAGASPAWSQAGAGRSVSCLQDTRCRRARQSARTAFRRRRGEPSCGDFYLHFRLKPVLLHIVFFLVFLCRSRSRGDRLFWFSFLSTRMSLQTQSNMIQLT